MTEYDYSPEAHERYMATQCRISNWVNETCSQSSHYVNPFECAHSITPSSTDFYSSSSRSSHSPPRPNASRSHSHTRNRSEDSHYSHPPRRHDRDYYIAHNPSRPSYSRSRSPSRYGSYSESRDSSNAHVPRSHTNYAHHLPHTHRSTPIYDMPSRSEKHPIPHHPVEYDSSYGHKLVLPPPRHGEKYVIVSPPGQNVEFTDLSRSTSVRYVNKVPPPASKRPEPLLKRLFGGMTSGKSNRTNGSRRSSY